MGRYGMFASPRGGLGPRPPKLTITSSLQSWVKLNRRNKSIGHINGPQFAKFIGRTGQRNDTIDCNGRGPTFGRQHHDRVNLALLVHWVIEADADFGPDSNRIRAVPSDHRGRVAIAHFSFGTGKPAVIDSKLGLGRAIDKNTRSPPLLPARAPTPQTAVSAQRTASGLPVAGPGAKESQLQHFGQWSHARRHGINRALIIPRISSSYNLPSDITIAPQQLPSISVLIEQIAQQFASEERTGFKIEGIRDPRDTP